MKTRDYVQPYDASPGEPDYDIGQIVGWETHHTPLVEWMFAGETCPEELAPEEDK